MTDWDLVEKVWEHAEDVRLKAKLSDHPVLLSEKPFNSSQSRMKYTVRRAQSQHRTPFWVPSQRVPSLEPCIRLSSFERLGMSMLSTLLVKPTLTQNPNSSADRLAKLSEVLRRRLCALSTTLSKLDFKSDIVHY